jgi:ubiquinone/menaquinone biosynthesis C-methylase UbiE
VTVKSGVAEELDLEDSSFDAAVACLVLCTVPSLSRALAEIRRVLKPGGELRFLEHVRSPSPRKGRFQVIADRSGVWPRIGGGCHSSRQTVEAITSAGFDLQQTKSLDFGPSWLITNPHVLGRAIS